MWSIFGTRSVFWVFVWFSFARAEYRTWVPQQLVDSLNRIQTPTTFAIKKNRQTMVLGTRFKILTRHININRYDAITTTYYWIRVMVIATTVGTTSHGNYPFGMGHLVVDFSKCWCHFICHRACDNYCVCLTWTCTKYNTVAVHVVTRRCNVHHFHGATCQPERHGPQWTLFKTNKIEISIPIRHDHNRDRNFVFVPFEQNSTSHQDEPMRIRSCWMVTLEMARTWTACQPTHRQRSSVLPQCFQLSSLVLCFRCANQTFQQTNKKPSQNPVDINAQMNIKQNNSIYKARLFCLIRWFKSSMDLLPIRLSVIFLVDSLNSNN